MQLNSSYLTTTDITSGVMQDLVLDAVLCIIFANSGYFSKHVSYTKLKCYNEYTLELKEALDKITEWSEANLKP